ncbi:hypothetical protein HAX54_003836 [Datura stramonium]|uniref:SEC63 domain-containing protein n=1 Tax=Datura stramonium TaxID=4076 RepID=A0ABS8T5Y4_DATST|nr:hypothetical protein [Datura stramonium]
MVRLLARRLVWYRSGYSEDIVWKLDDSSMCNEQHNVLGSALSAHLVVVMGTQYYDGRENAHGDYPVSDLLQMVGHASRPLVDSSGSVSSSAMHHARTTTRSSYTKHSQWRAICNTISTTISMLRWWECGSVTLGFSNFYTLQRELAKKRQENQGKSIETVFDLVYMGITRHELLQMSEPHPMDIAHFCNRFPKRVDLYLHSSYPKAKEEGWWLVVGDTKSNQLLAIKRVTLQRKSKIKLDFAAPAEAGTRTTHTLISCDSYLGCDQNLLPHLM